MLFCLSLYLRLNWACVVSIKISCTDSYIHVYIFHGLIFNYMPSHEQNYKQSNLFKKRKENQFLKKYKGISWDSNPPSQPWQLYVLYTALIRTVTKSGFHEKMYHSETNTFCYVRKSKIRITDSYEFIRQMHECQFNFVYLYKHTNRIDCRTKTASFSNKELNTDNWKKTKPD